MSLPQSQPLALEVFCLGRFQLRYQSYYVNTSASRSNKTWLILKFLFTRNQRMVATDVLVDTFWPDSPAALGRQALYTCIHRLRASLRSAGLEDLVITEGGLYGLNPEKTVVVDAEIFEETVKDALALPNDERERMLKQALQIYKGDFLPEHIYDDWAKPAQIHYRAMYRQAIVAYADLLVHDNRLIEARTLLEEALTLEPFEEEFHVRLLNVLWDSGAHTDAAKHYHHTHSLLYHEYGIQPSPKLQLVFNKLKETSSSQADTNLESLQETISNMNQSHGAFFCTPDEYMMICRLEQRKLNRDNHNPAEMASILVNSKNPTAAKALLEVFRRTLRQGDVVSQWNDSLFLLLFPDTTSDVVQKIMRRVHKRFLEHKGSGPTKLLVRIKAIGRPVQASAKPEA